MKSAIVLTLAFVFPLSFAQNPTRVVVRAPFAQSRAKRDVASAPAVNFATAVTYAAGGNSAPGIAVADLNADGKSDLVIATECTTTNCTNGEVGVLLGNGDGTFQPAVVYGSGGYWSTAVAVFDFNSDGRPDLVVTNRCTSSTSCQTTTVGVLLGNGDGTFQPAVTYGTAGGTAFAVAVGDVNRDGKSDLLIANDNPPTLAVLLGNGDGTFQPAVTYDTGGSEPLSLVVADVNDDGKPDVVVANDCGVTSCNGELGVLLGNGDGTFKTAVTYGTGGYDATAVAVADVNGDGKPDVVVSNILACGTCNYDGIVGVLLGNGDGTFQAAVPYGTGGESALGVAVADVNMDGKLDLLVVNEVDINSNSNGTIGVLLGNGDGTFQPAIAYNTGGASADAVAVADVNGDGKPDLLVANPSTSVTTEGGTVGVLINTTPTTTTSLQSSVNPCAFGTSVTLTATVTSQVQGAPTGTVSFFDGTASLGTSTLSGSAVATLTISTLSVGTHSITASYGGDANFLPSTSQVLSQVVQGAIGTVSPSSINFGNQTVGIASAPQNVTFSSTGNIALNLTSITVSGNNGTFTQTNNCGSSVAAGASCTVTVTWTPGVAGSMSGSLTFNDNATNNPQTVSLSGTGVVPAVALSPASLTFPTQVVYTTSTAQTVTLSNTGQGLLTISKISVSTQFSQTNTCGTSVAAGANCTISVKFRPTAINTITGSLSITDNASGSPQTVSLTGTGTYIQLMPTSLNFGNQPVGTKSAGKKVTLSNKGHVSVSLTSISFTGKNAGDFAQTNTCGTSVAAGATCYITITFTPANKGKRTANLSVSDNGGGSPQTVSLSGTGT
jgi:hypothetical protein